MTFACTRRARPEVCADNLELCCVGRSFRKVELRIASSELTTEDISGPNLSRPAAGVSFLPCLMRSIDESVTEAIETFTGSSNLAVDRWQLYNLLVPVLHNLRVTLEMIKWEHSVFALPFALCGAMLAAGGFPSLHQLAWIIVAMIAARSAAMAFNRWADASIDAANPRTSTRALPAGQLSSAFVVTFVIVSSLVFILAASQLNRLALLLSPVALAVLLLYSYTKRLTRWSHLVLGFALGIAPAAAWIAVRGSLDPRILLLTAAVTFWVGGFD